MKHLKKNIFRLLSFTAIASAIIFMQGCEKDKHIPPKLVFKTGGSYTSADDTVSTNTSITVGIVADKVEDDLKTYNISYAYDGATSTTTKENFSISTPTHYEKDYSFTTRNTAGKEKWIFSVIDKDGNITKLEVLLTVN